MNLGYEPLWGPVDGYEYADRISFLIIPLCEVGLFLVHVCSEDTTLWSSDSVWGFLIT
jgi:hypothetical protein